MGSTWPLASMCLIASLVLGYLARRAYRKALLAKEKIEHSSDFREFNIALINQQGKDVKY